MEEMKKWKREKVNNKGMTLVEVLVAMAILTVVSLALLQAFVSSVNYNKDAKEKQRGINLAQTIMESYKAYKLEDVCRQFNNVDPFIFYKGVIGSYAETGGSVDVYGNFTPSPTNEYSFVMNDVQYDNNLYDVEVAMKANPDAISSAEIAETPQFNAYNDAIFYQPSDEYKYVYEDAIDQLKDAGMKDELLPTVTTLDKSKITIDKRKVEISMYEYGGAEIVSAKVTYQYTIADYEFITTEDLTDTLDGSYTVTVDGTKDSTVYDVYNNSVTRPSGAHLENLYVYFYPAYKTDFAGVACDSDEIYVYNNTGSSHKVFLVKMVTPGFSSANIMNSESTYRPTVVIGGSHCSEVYHNIGKKLSGDGVALYNMSDANSSAESCTFHDEWYDKETKVLVYDIEITVTNKKKGAVEIVLNGSANDR